MKKLDNPVKPFGRTRLFVIPGWKPSRFGNIPAINVGLLAFHDDLRYLSDKPLRRCVHLHRFFLN